jgi:hypothetical protein
MPGPIPPAQEFMVLPALAPDNNNPNAGEVIGLPLAQLPAAQDIAPARFRLPQAPRSPKVRAYAQRSLQREG